MRIFFINFKSKKNQKSLEIIFKILEIIFFKENGKNILKFKNKIYAKI